MNEDQVRKGRKAEQLLQDEVFAAALEKLENEQLWAFKGSKPEEADKREQAYAMIKAIELFKTEVTKMVDNGKLAQRAIERAQKVLV